MTNDTQNLIGTVDIPFHGLDGKDGADGKDGIDGAEGKSAYEVACANGFTGTEKEWLESLLIPDSIFASCLKLGYTWYIDTDTVKDASGKAYGTLSSCMTEDFTGTWFYVRTSSSEAGSAAYPSSYAIDGANGYLSLRDYVVWTGVHLVHIPIMVYEAITALEAQITALKAQINGISFGTDENGNLTYEKEETQ